MSNIKLKGATSGESILKAPAVAGTDTTITLPKASIDLSTAGTDGQFLKTDGAGTLSFATVSTSDATKLPLAGGTMTGTITAKSIGVAANSYVYGSSGLDLYGDGSDNAAKLVQIVDGNVKFASGKGIDFSAASGDDSGMTSEVLDDYEEGLWTGVLKYDSNTPSTDSNVCQYVKVGNLCHAQGRISVTNDPGGNALTCQGLPFAAADPGGDGNAACGSVYMEAVSSNVDYGWVVSFVGDAGTTIMFRRSGTTGSGNAVASYAGSGTNYMFSVTYPTA